MSALREKYNTIGGKLNHLRYNEKCREAPQRENFENKCQECGRQFTSPYRLKEHQKYICIQQETDEEEEEREKQMRRTTMKIKIKICRSATKRPRKEKKVQKQALKKQKRKKPTANEKETTLKEPNHKGKRG